MFVERLQIKAAYEGCYCRLDLEVQVFFVLCLSQHQFDAGTHSLSLSAVWRLGC